MQALGQGRDEPRRNFRAQNADRMRIKGNGDASGSEFAGAAAGMLDDPAMTTVDAVEITDGDDGGTVVGGKLIECSDDLHGYSSKGMRRPS